jgi:polyphenol oxidase
VSTMEFLEAGTGTPAVRAVFTTRAGGGSTGAFAALNLSATTGDGMDVVRANRAAVAGALGFDPQRAVVLEQVHGAEVLTVGPGGGQGAYLGSLAGVVAADASVSREPGVTLLAMGADCPGVLLWLEDASCVGAAHAGWRGLVGGVLEAAVHAMGSHPRHVRAVVGPGVGPCCYPVDASMRRTMSSRFGAQVVAGDAVDLTEAARAALLGCGVLPEAIITVGGCTSCDPARFYSYRRDGAATGRHAGIIWRVEEA